MADPTNEEETEKAKIHDQTHDGSAVVTIHKNRILTTGS